MKKGRILLLSHVDGGMAINHIGGIMRRSVRCIAGMIALGGLGWMAHPASAATYTDPAGDNWGDTSVDLTSAVITNDASNIYFTINLNPSANIGTSGDYYANYELGFQMNGGAGGQTAINGTYGTGNPAAGNAYGSAVGISTGMNYFIGTYLAGPSYSGGAQLYSYSSTSGWNQVDSTMPLTQVNTGTPSLSFAFPLADLGLTGGSTFNFDVWTTYSGGQAAYDALDNVGTGSSNAPYSSGTTYDSATAPGTTFASTVYTVTVPEPASMGLICVMGTLLGLRRRK
jgi:hypothetical protein